MYEHLGDGRIRDSKGKVWFFHSIKNPRPPLTTDPEILKTMGPVILAVADSWATDYLSDDEIFRYRTTEWAEIPFKEITFQTRPFRKVKSIVF